MRVLTSDLLYIREALKKIGKVLNLVLNKEGGSGSTNFLCFLVTIFGAKTSKNVMKHLE